MSEILKGKFKGDVGAKGKKMLKTIDFGKMALDSKSKPVYYKSKSFSQGEYEVKGESIDIGDIIKLKDVEEY